LTEGLQIIDEISRAPAKDVRDYISVKIAGLLKTTQFVDALPAYMLPDEASQGRMRILMDRLTQIAKIT
jgi:hypothetical protein